MHELWKKQKKATIQVQSIINDVGDNVVGAAAVAAEPDNLIFKPFSGKTWKGQILK